MTKRAARKQPTDGLSESDRNYILGIIAAFRARGYRLFLHPVMANRYREWDLWADDVCVETKPLPTRLA